MKLEKKKVFVYCTAIREPLSAWNKKLTTTFTIHWLSTHRFNGWTKSHTKKIFATLTLIPRRSLPPTFPLSVSSLSLQSCLGMEEWTIRGDSENEGKIGERKKVPGARTSTKVTTTTRGLLVPVATSSDALSAVGKTLKMRGDGDIYIHDIHLRVCLLFAVALSNLSSHCIVHSPWNSQESTFSTSFFLSLSPHPCNSHPNVSFQLCLHSLPRETRRERERESIKWKLNTGFRSLNDENEEKREQNKTFTSLSILIFFPSLSILSPLHFSDSNCSYVLPSLL